MCICEDRQIGDEVILKSVETPFLLGGKVSLDLAVARTNKWEAGIHAWVTVSRQNRVLLVEHKINYCPMCGRRLSLRDAGKG